MNIIEDVITNNIEDERVLVRRLRQLGSQSGGAWSAVSFAAMIAGMPPTLICNVEETQFRVGGATKERVVVKFCTDILRPDCLKSSRSPGNAATQCSNGIFLLLEV